MLRWVVLPLFFMLSACGPEAEPAPVNVPAPAAISEPQRYSVEIIRTVPHRTEAYTQGLFFADGDLYEATGKRGASSIARLRAGDGSVMAERPLPGIIFGEGAAALDGRIYSLSWTSGRGFVHDLKTLEPLAEFSYSGEGWGLTTDGTSLIMSDGTAVLRYLDPQTFAETRRVIVRLSGQPVKKLNELEWVNGEIWANIWQTETIARIDPESGAVTGLIDVSNLFPAAQRKDQLDDVPNGIAFDPASKRLFLTGKRWPEIYEVKIIEAE